MIDFIRKHDLGYKLLALLLAIGFWFYVMGVKDPEITLTVRDVPVNYIGESKLSTQYDLQIISGRLTAVDIRVTGARSKILPLKKTDISVTANVSDITEAGNYTVNCRVVMPDSGINLSMSGGVSLSLFVDSVSSAEIPVVAHISGEPADGYTLGAPQIDPATIKISGPSTEIKKISRALVEIKAGTIAESFYGEYSYSLVEVDGSVCKSTYVQSDTSKIVISVPVLVQKTVPLDVLLHESGALVSENAQVSITPREITISGERNVIDSISYILLGTVNLEDIGSNGFSQQMSVTMPEGITNVSGITTADVNITLKNIATRTFTVSQFHLVNVPDGKTATVLDSEKQITVRGSEEVLASLSGDDFILVADLSSVSSENGKKNVPAEVIYDETTSRASTVGTYTLQIQLSNK